MFDVPHEAVPEFPLSVTTANETADGRFGLWVKRHQNQIIAWAKGLLLVAALIFAYHPEWHGGFFWDESGYITKPDLRSLTGLARVWIQPTATLQYYPLLFSFFWLAHRLWGDLPTGYHFANILLHACVALLFVRLLQRLKIPGAWLAGIIFALHPVQVEAVSWISEIKSTLSGIFYLGSALVYLKYDQDRGKARYAVSFGLFVLGLLAKSAIMTLPAALLLIFWWQRGKLSWKRDVLPLVPFFIVGIADGLVTEWMEQNVVGAKGSVFHFSIAEHILIAGRDIWFYSGELVWPANLMVNYPRWDINQGVWWQYLFPVGVVALVAVLCRLRTFGRGPLTAWLYFIGTLFPALDFANVYYLRFSFVADHMQYLACMGPIVLAAAGLRRIVRRAGRKSAILWPAGCAVLFVSLGILTWRQSRMFHDPETLWRTTIVKNPHSWVAENNLGLLLAGDGKVSQAIVQFDRAIAEYHQQARVPQADPEYCRLLCNLANALVQAGDLDEAAIYFTRALQVNPQYVAAGDLDHLGNALFRKGMVDAAIVQYQIALQLKPDFAQAENDLGNALFKRGDLDGAFAQYQKALQTQPDFAEACYNLGNVLMQKGNVTQAIAYYQQALQLDPHYADAGINLGNALLQIGNVDGAIVQYQQAQQMAPGSVEACNNLGNAWLQKGNTSQAIIEYQRALQIQPDSVNALNNLAWVLATAPQSSLRDGPKAVELALQANRLTGAADPDILGTLATAYAESGRFPEAVTTIQRAIQLAEKQSDSNLANSLRAELKLFQSGAPFHTH